MSHAGANGRLLNNSYYISGMVVLFTFFFSLPGPVADFRYTLCMVSCECCFCCLTGRVQWEYSQRVCVPWCCSCSCPYPFVPRQAQCSMPNPPLPTFFCRHCDCGHGVYLCGLLRCQHRLAFHGGQGECASYLPCMVCFCTLRPPLQDAANPASSSFAHHCLNCPLVLCAGCADGAGRRVGPDCHNGAPQLCQVRALL